jgi:hypothetical protein
LGEVIAVAIIAVEIGLALAKRAEAAHKHASWRLSGRCTGLGSCEELVHDLGAGGDDGS